MTTGRAILSEARPSRAGNTQGTPEDLVQAGTHTGVALQGVLGR